MPTRTLLILLVSCTIACCSARSLFASSLVVALDTVALTEATDTLSVTMPADSTIAVQAGDEASLADSATSATSVETEPPTAGNSVATPAQQSAKAPDGTKVSSGELPFVKRMTRWFTRYPNSSVALICSIVPGGGQLYNQRYWKIPIVLSAMTAGVYAVTWNQRLYREYHTAYADLLSEHPLEHTSWQAFIPANADPSKYVTDGNLRSRLERGSKQYKENRDLSVVLTVALYLLSALDAYVDAELYYFDVSPRLTIDMGEGLRDKSSGPRPQSVMVGATVRF
ncbi:DUF5683 domain-containing protein [Porphyromonas sp.]|uniref:DUF5683 domain-containing protein n=1 Tax=Porphyromonas sp. TaxID=1924944 RepID=UPI0025FFD0B8|nr:DUF5683 domain-containing protein [Porphyromonas sp.]